MLDARVGVLFVLPDDHQILLGCFVATYGA
jgi:hypothetical protein